MKWTECCVWHSGHSSGTVIEIGVFGTGGITWIVSVSHLPDQLIEGKQKK